MEDIVIKLATIENNPEFNGLVNACGGQPLLKSIFGQYNFSSLVEFSYLTLIASNDKECLGFVAFNDGGLVSGEMESFDEILEELRPIIPVKVSNTLFLNFWAIDINIDFDIELGDAIMRKAFHYCPDVDYFLWLGHKSVRLSDYMKERFVELDCSSREGAGGNGDPLKNFRVFAMHRSKYLPKLQVREARVEDNDDLLPILKASNPHLLANQDDFFLADLIQTQDHRNRFFVGVDNNIPVGMLSTSLDVNIHLITRIFDMDCYVDLLRTPMVEIKYKQMFFLGICANQAQCDILNMHSHEEGCVVYDASTSAVLTAYDAQEGDSDVTIDDVVDDINRHISALKLTALSAGPRADKVPQAVVLLNFPRNSNEARLYLASPATPTVTAVVELSSADKEEEFKETKGESKLEEDGKVNEDEWEVMLSTLRSNLLGADGLGNKSTEWIKLATSEDDVQSLGFQYLTVLKSLLDSHKEPEEPLADTPKTSSLVANGFALTVFCTTSELESRASDLLKVAFEEYPHLDYCLLMLPNDAPPTSLTRLMTQVKLRVGISFDQSLYVLHRQTLLAHEYLHVTRLIASLEKSVIRFVEPLGADGDSLMEAAYAALVENDVDLKDNPSEACFVAMLGGDVVGMMTISRKSASTEDINWFRANYQIEDQVSYDRHRGRAQAVITDWTMTPTFSRWGRYMLREVMRHYGKTLIYYQCPENCCPPIEVLNEMIPVLPRTRMQAALPQLPRGRVKEVPPPEPLPLVARPSENAPSNSCPLFYIAKNQLVTPKQIVSTRIVVVGGCLSTFPLLETLMFVPYIQLTNVYLVMESPPTAVTENNKGSKANSEPPAREYSPPPSPDKSGAGTPKPVKLTEVCKHALYSSEADYAGCLSVVDTCEPLDQMVRAMGFNHTVTVIRGRLTDIDRAHKAIIVSDETVVEYDILVVAPGTHDLSYKQFQIYSTLHPVRAADKGMFGIGSCFEDRRAVNWIRKMQYKNTFAGVVVYGGGLEAWHAVGRLLQMECIEKSRINWIIPDTDLPDLGDDLIDDIAVVALENSDIKIWRNCELVFINCADDLYGTVQSVEILRTPEEEDSEEEEGVASKKTTPAPQPENLKLACFCFIGAFKPECSVDVFTAVNDSGLVYDGGVVVDNNFRTVDPAIYSVGDISRFSRLFRDVLPHSHYNRRELGVYCAKRILARHLDPLSPEVEYGFLKRSDEHTDILQPTAASCGTVPHPKQYKSISVCLPGGLQYFRSRLVVDPSEEIVPMVTKDNSVGSVFVLKMDSLGVVTEIIYIGGEKIELRNYSKLIGWHETFLNNASFTFNSGLVHDWVTFFRDGWSNATYHDKFEELANTMRKALESDKTLFNILDKVFETAESSSDDLLVAGKRREILGDRGELLFEGTKQTLESLTLDFLRKHKHMLPKYYVPSVGAKGGAQSTRPTNKRHDFKDS